MRTIFIKCEKPSLEVTGGAKRTGDGVSLLKVEMVTSLLTLLNS